MKKILLVLLIIFCLTEKDFAQQAKGEKIIFPSPQAAQLGKFGGFNVNHSSGSPNVSIPIYTAKEGDIEIPISLAYHYTGLRPADLPGWCGTGWSLAANGVISRVVKGRRDELPNIGYIARAAAIKDVVDDGGPNGTKFQNLDILENAYDNYPDIFSFQFMGYSGKFVFDESGVPQILSDQKLQITYVVGTEGTYSGANSIISWTIISEDGSKFTFGKYDLSSTMETGNTWDTSSWHLTEVLNVKGDKVTFEYTTIDTSKKRLQLGRTERIAVNNSNVSQSSTYSLNLANNPSHEVYLQKIGGSTWEINFNSSVYTKTLSTSEVSSGRRLDNIQIVSKIPSSTLIKEFSFVFNSAMQLQSVGETGLPPYQLAYYGTIPNGVDGYTTQVDYWGYYNGQTNTSLIPGDFSNDLEPRVDLTKIGALQRITYPTQGYTIFQYEQNDYSYVQGAYISKSKIIVENYTYSWQRSSGGMTTGANPSFTLSETTRVDIKVNVLPNNTISVCSSLNQQEFSLNLPMGTYTGEMLFGDNAFYPCNQNFNTVGFNIGLSVKVFRKQGINVGDYGGVRVSNITDYDASGTSISSRSYNYKAVNDPAVSSGFISSEPVYNLDLSYIVGTSRIYSSQPFNPTAMGTHYYKDVKETNEQFITQYSYTSHLDQIDNKGEYSFTSHKAVSGYFVVQLSSFLELGNFKSYDFMRSLIKRITVTDLAGTLKEDRGFGYINTDRIVAPALHHEYLLSYETPLPLSGQMDSWRLYYDKALYVVGGWPRKVSETIVTYGSNGANPVTTQKTFSYGSNHLQLSQQTITKSDGTIEETNFKYPLDYLSGGNTDLQSMITANMVTYPVEQTTYSVTSPTNKKITDATVTTYKSFTGNSNKPTLILPYKHFKFNGFNGSISSFASYSGASNETASTSYRETLKYTNYDTQGNPLSLIINGADNISYLWAYKGQYPVAEIKNADNAQVLTALGGTSFGSMAAMTDSPTIKTKLDAVRTALPSAFVTSYTYIPLVGVSIVTDPAGKSLYYDYDGLERLANIRNSAGGAIRNSYCYNYAGQMVSCGSIVATGTVTPPTVSLLADGVACNYDVTAVISNATPKMGGALTLTANCGTPDCSGVTFTSSGNGLLAGTGSPRSFNAPGVTGTFRYIITSTKPGCTTQKDTVAINVIEGGTLVLANGCYTIGTYASLIQPVTNTVNAYVKAFDPSSSNDQIWKVESTDTEKYKITSVTSGLVLNPEGNLAGGLVKNQLKTWVNADYQKWYISSWTGAGGGYQVANKSNPTIPLQNAGGVGTGTFIDFNATLGGGHQRYTFTSVTCPTARMSAEAKQPVIAQEEISMVIFPNPVKEFLQIQVTGENAVTNVEILNGTGAAVMTATQVPADGLDIHELSGGVYLVKIMFADGSGKTYKIVKE